MQEKKNPSPAFASDNAAGELPALAKSRFYSEAPFALGYGNDPETAEAMRTFKKHFGKRAEPLFVYGGTGANIIALAAFLKPHQAAVCPATSHLYIDECGAPERFVGCKLIGVETSDGKLRPEQVEKVLSYTTGIVHRVQPALLSITQPTEAGTVYSFEELEALASFAKERGLALHLDGARLSNAAVHLGCGFKELTQEAGIDVATFGGTKNGLAFGEAVIFFDPEKAEEAAYIQKQAGQLPSKMRMISGPLAMLLESGLWRENAARANRMATLLAGKLQEIPGVKINQKVESNGVFCSVPPEWIPELKKRYHFVVWNPAISEIRLMTSFMTTEEEIAALVKVFMELG